MTAAESPYAGTTVPPPGAGTRKPLETGQSEHRPGGMLNNGPEVLIRHSSMHSRSVTRGVVVDFTSVPAAHLTVRLDSGKLRIIFCSAIEYLELA